MGNISQYTTACQKSKGNSLPSGHLSHTIFNALWFGMGWF